MCTVQDDNEYSTLNHPSRSVVPIESYDTIERNFADRPPVRIILHSITLFEFIW